MHIRRLKLNAILTQFAVTDKFELQCHLFYVLCRVLFYFREIYSYYRPFVFARKSPVIPGYRAVPTYIIYRVPNYIKSETCRRGIALYINFIFFLKQQTH